MVEMQLRFPHCAAHEAGLQDGDEKKNIEKQGERSRLAQRGEDPKRRRLAGENSPHKKATVAVGHQTREAHKPETLEHATQDESHDHSHQRGGLARLPQVDPAAAAAELSLARLRLRP